MSLALIHYTVRKNENFSSQKCDYIVILQHNFIQQSKKSGISFLPIRDWPILIGLYK